MLKQTIYRKLKLTTVLLFILLAGVPLSQSERKLRMFTWIGHDVTQVFADWVRDLGFSDVVVRYGTNDQSSYDNLAQHGITFWRWVQGALGESWWTVQDYVDRLTYEISQSPSENIYVDDCDAVYNLHGQQAFQNLLDAVRQIQNGNIILCFYASSQTAHYHGFYDFASLFDLSTFNIDVYHPPTTDLEPLLTRMNPNTLGLYLWCWTGSSPYDVVGSNWGTITEGLIRKKFAEAKLYGLARMGVWNGHETDAVEAGMYQASLYNYPGWWSLIKSLTLDLEIIPELVWLLLFGGIATPIIFFALKHYKYI